MIENTMPRVEAQSGRASSNAVNPPRYRERSTPRSGHAEFILNTDGRPVGTSQYIIPKNPAVRKKLTALCGHTSHHCEGILHARNGWTDLEPSRRRKAQVIDMCSTHGDKAEEEPILLHKYVSRGG
jgi:hypothetical protein